MPEEKNLQVDLEKTIQLFGSRCDGITWFLLYESIQRNVKKPYHAVTNLSKYHLKVDEMDLS